MQPSSSVKVTLHTESVDWNKQTLLSTNKYPSHSPYRECGLKLMDNHQSTYITSSLSIQRVWIEILIIDGKEYMKWSLSIQRVWIEILASSVSTFCNLVTLHTESVDWNNNVVSSYCESFSHSPYRECGLKWSSNSLLYYRQESLSIQRVWIEIFLFLLIS